MKDLFATRNAGIWAIKVSGTNYGLAPDTFIPFSPLLGVMAPPSAS
jgi:hypothetical protein